MLSVSPSGSSFVRSLIGRLGFSPRRVRDVSRLDADPLSSGKGSLLAFAPVPGVAVIDVHFIAGNPLGEGQAAHVVAGEDRIHHAVMPVEQGQRLVLGVHHGDRHDRPEDLADDEKQRKGRPHGDR